MLLLRNQQPRDLVLDLQFSRRDAISLTLAAAAAASSNSSSSSKRSLTCAASVRFAGRLRRRAAMLLRFGGEKFICLRSVSVLLLLNDFECCATTTVLPTNAVLIQINCSSFCFSYTARSEHKETTAAAATTNRNEEASWFGVSTESVRWLLGVRLLRHTACAVARQP